LAEAFTLESFTAGDGYVWRYRRYLALGDAKAEVVFLHGIQSHAGWYGFSCTKLSEAGFNVSFLDRRGSGLNQEARGDAPSFRRLLDDIAEYLGSLPRTVTRGDKVARLPVFVAGISWGGKLVLALERRHPGLADGIVLLCPGIISRIRPTLGQRLGILAARLLRPRKLFNVPLNDPELFTATPHWQQFLRDDPLRLHQATARLLVESARLDGYLRFVPKYVHVPLLLLLAEHDRIVHNKKTREYIERCAAKDKTVVEYAGANHTLEFEPDPQVFLTDLKEWLERHSTST
jgi:alpha-beta hydrolase superfamily lysophospholipase